MLNDTDEARALHRIRVLLVANSEHSKASAATSAVADAGAGLRSRVRKMEMRERQRPWSSSNAWKRQHLFYGLLFCARTQCKAPCSKHVLRQV
jgi:hypothetical protein